MYLLKTINKGGLDYLELNNAEGISAAHISLSEGASLQVLKLNGVQVIGDLYPMQYKETYASSILFPFANRVKNGKYTFNGEKYTLACNETNKNNALHGLVYNKTFKCVKKKLTTDFASVTLNYEHKGETEGFPFCFSMAVTYRLYHNEIQMSVMAKNKDPRPFPFTLGWHPYFKSKDLFSSSLNFKCNKKFQTNAQHITTDMVDFKKIMPLDIKSTKFNDAYLLEDDAIVFSTPEYLMHLRADYPKCFLQLYTPSKPNVIAIEPMTGVSDSFNNQLGLKKLDPDQSFTVTWNVSVKSNTDHDSNPLNHKTSN